MSNTYVLDACALVALFKNEDGADKITEVYKKAESREVELIINRVNLLEVFYGFYHDKGKDYADKLMESVEQSVVSIREFDKNIFQIAGRLKASHRISLADSIALAQAIFVDGKLLTADHHEFDVLDGVEPIIFFWIR